MLWHTLLSCSGGQMSSSELCGDVSSSLWKLNFIDKVADDGQQRTCLVGAGYQQNIFLSLCWCVCLCLHVCLLYQKSWPMPWELGIREESEWQWKQINHADELGHKWHTHIWSFPSVDLFCCYHLHLTQKMRNDERVHTWLIIKKMVTTKPSQNNTIDDLLYFFRSTVQMTSDGTKKEEENQKHEPVPALVFSGVT